MTKLISILLTAVLMTACDSGAPTDTVNTKSVNAPTDGTPISSPDGSGIVPTFAATPTPTPNATPTPIASPTPSATPSPTATPSATPTASSTATSSNHSCSIMSDASIMCSGDDTYDESPVQTTTVPSPSTILVGSTISCAVSAAHNLYCWGAGTDRGAGASQANTLNPTEIVSTSNVTSVAVSMRYGCALVGANVKCWGSSQTETESSPTQDSGTITDTLTVVAVGGGAKCALGTHLWCWDQTHTATQQTIWGAGAGYDNIYTASDQVCVYGVKNGNVTTLCYANGLSSSGQLN